MELIMKLLLFAILYVVIETAVRQGINTSVIGKYVKQDVTKASKQDLDD
ncbi:hypothetical protein SAMN04487943_103227 [Gracilibacillus orientalis]|uniref:Uncharacterized protein n=2 Tax=Gracilibacillus orientalis TaxID=334253 RepID=A0A1I4JY33_9BACI|nr:hypothetical protein SAMN04487943_103227 [Gracilibacillus orientalis]